MRQREKELGLEMVRRDDDDDDAGNDSPMVSKSLGASSQTPHTLSTASTQKTNMKRSSDQSKMDGRFSQKPTHHKSDDLLNSFDKSTQDTKHQTKQSFSTKISNKPKEKKAIRFRQNSASSERCPEYRYQTSKDNSTSKDLKESSEEMKELNKDGEKKGKFGKELHQNL